MHGHNLGATFQAASQFNCLEFASPDCTPENGVTSYMHDRTQGPACALACAAGTVYRNYFVPTTSPTGQTEIGQTQRNQLNNLHRLECLLDNDQQHYWTVRNGYVFSDISSLTRLNEELATLFASGGRDEVMGSIMVGVQKDTEVTFGSRFHPLDADVSMPSVISTAHVCQCVSCFMRYI
jgi:hypothetical protein